MPAKNSSSILISLRLENSTPTKNKPSIPSVKCEP